MAVGKLRAIVFDIGRVLIRVDVALAMADLASGVTLSAAELWAAIEKDPRWPDWQEGRISARDWHQHLARRLGISLTFEQFTQAWNQALDPKPMQDSGFLERLSKSYRLALLSNTDPIHVAYMEGRYDFFRFFPVRIYSCALAASKPSPLLYLEALKGCKVRAQEAVYIDDICAYVDAARRLGMAGIHYQSTEALVDSLKGLGVNV